MNAASSAAEPYRPVAEPVLSYRLIYHEALHPTTLALPDSALTPTRTALSQVDVSTTLLLLSSPRSSGWPARVFDERRQIHDQEPHRNAADCTNASSKVAADR